MSTSQKPRGGTGAARIRAAAAYADFNRKDLGEALGYSVETVSALFAGEKTADAKLRGRIADACGVPQAFMDVGFAPLERPVSSVEVRLVELEGRFDELERRMATRSAGDDMPVPGGELGRDLAGTPTSERSQPRNGSREAGDARRGTGL